MDFSIFGTSMRELFQIRPINLSVAVWVGFLALFGIASDDGVIMATYLKQTFTGRKPATIKEILGATIEAGRRRARLCLMTVADYRPGFTLRVNLTSSGFVGMEKRR